MPESVSSQFASTFPNHYKSATELCVGGINGLINMEGSRLGGTFYRDVTFSPGQILTGFINLNVSDRSQKELMGGAKLKSEVFSVVLKCDVSIYNLTQMKATGGENHFTYTASHAPMYSGDAGLAKVAIQAALRKAVGQHNATLFCFEVPVDDNGEFTIQIPDSILLPPDIVCDLGRLTYTLCPISHRNKFTGHEFSLVMNNNLPSQQQHLFPKKLPLMPPAEHTGVIPGKVHVSAFTSSASMDVTIVAGSLYTAVLGTQTVHTMITLQPGAHAILNAKNLVFCDVKAEFVNRISSKGGKHRLDYVSGEVSARASLRALLADQEQNASETVTLTLELRRSNLGPPRVSGPFYLIETGNHDSAIAVAGHIPDEYKEKPEAESSSGSSSSNSTDATTKANRYLLASEWFVVVTVTLAEESKSIFGIKMPKKSSSKENDVRTVRVEVPIEVTITRERRPEAQQHGVDGDELPGYQN